VAGEFSRRVYNQPGIMTEVTKSLGQKTQIPMPEKLIWANTKVCKKQDSHQKKMKSEITRKV
jgi:hypothetical protein